MDDIPKFVKYALAAYLYRSFIGGIISGEFAKGKTVTAIKIAAKILQCKYGYTFEQALDEVISKYMIFTADEFIDLTHKLYDNYDWENIDELEVLKIKREIRLPVLIWDDAGIHASSKKDRFDPGESWELQTEYDTIRDITSCLILTVPEEAELMKFLRGYRSNYFIELGYPEPGGGRNDRVMHFYKYDRDKKTGNMKRYLKWSTKKSHSIHLDNWAYGKYDKKRTIAKLRHSKKLKKKKEERDIIKQYKLLKKKVLIEKYAKELEDLK